MNLEKLRLLRLKICRKVNSTLSTQYSSTSIFLGRQPVRSEIGNGSGGEKCTRGFSADIFFMWEILKCTKYWWCIYVYNCSYGLMNILNFIKAETTVGLEVGCW